VSARARPRIVFLGTAGGPTVAAHRHGIATAFVVGEDVYLIDAGVGVISQYVDARLRLDRLRAVLLTHMHGDHVCDLFNLFKSVHTEVSDVGRIAAAAGVPTPALNHFVPASRTTAPQQWIKRISEHFNGRIIVAEDLMSLPVRRATGR
jgi:ribonuclease BN (tRNA processing enzyme)